VIIAFRSLDKPITFEKIKEVTGIPVSTANNIWRHAKKNASEARKAGGVPGPLDAPLALAELITSSALDPKARSGRPGLLSKEDKDRLVLFVKRDFDTRRMKIIDIRREAGFLHVGQTTLLRALKERGIGAYQQCSEPSGGPTGTAGIMPRRRAGTGPLTVVLGRSSCSGDGRARLGPQGPTR